MGACAISGAFQAGLQRAEGIDRYILSCSYPDALKTGGLVARHHDPAAKIAQDTPSKPSKGGGGRAYALPVPEHGSHDLLPPKHDVLWHPEPVQRS